MLIPGPAGRSGAGRRCPPRPPDCGRRSGTDPDLWNLIPPGPVRRGLGRLHGSGSPTAPGRTDATLYTIVDKGPAGQAPPDCSFPAGHRYQYGAWSRWGWSTAPASTRRTAGTEALPSPASPAHVLDTLSYRRLEWRCGPAHTAIPAEPPKRFRLHRGRHRLPPRPMWTKGPQLGTRSFYSILDRAMAGDRRGGWRLGMSPQNFDGGWKADKETEKPG